MWQPMKMHAVLALLVVGAGAINLRTADLERSMFNNTISEKVWSHSVGLLQREVEMVRESPPVKDKLLYVILSVVGTGACGIDRCYMGQPLLGVLKCISTAIIPLWCFIDAIYAYYHAFYKTTEISGLFYYATFHPESINSAYLFACVWVMIALAPLVLYCCCACCMACALAKSATAQCQDLNVEPPPSHEAASAVLPTALKKKLRDGGYMEQQLKPHEAIQMFDNIDTNKDGNLDRDELKEYMSANGFTDENIDTMIKGADTDKDGKINREEFTKYLFGK